jgi:hypothetical protein
VLSYGLSAAARANSTSVVIVELRITEKVTCPNHSFALVVLCELQQRNRLFLVEATQDHRTATNDGRWGAVASKDQKGKSHQILLVIKRAMD